MQSGTNPIAKNIFKDLKSKNQTSDYIENNQNRLPNLADPDQGVKLQDSIHNKRIIKAFRKKLTASQVRKIVYQALETGQQPDEQSQHHEQQNRKWNDGENSEGMLEDQDENLSDFEEEEKSVEFNYNLTGAIDNSGCANKKKYKNCSKN